MIEPLNGRVTVYTNQVPYEADILRSNSYKMADVSKLAETVLGTGISNAKLVSGLPCLPISPPGLQVTVGSGCLYSFESYDATAYSVLPADNDPNHRLYKQALNFDLVTLDTPAPLVIGDSIIYLVQAAFETLDVNVVSRPYFNSADPTDPIFNNLSDTRTDKILINVKNGVSSPSPTPPTPDAGFVPLYYVTVAFGQVAIISNNITVATSAPFITESLTQKVGYSDLRSSKYTYFQDSGSLNSLVVTADPVYSNFNAGTTITVKAANTITGASSLTIGAIGPVQIKVVGSDTTAGQISSGGVYTFVSDGTFAQLLNPSVTPSLFYGASVYASVSQAISTGQTKINYNTPIYDTNSLFDSTNHRFIVGKIGYFSFNANVGFSGASSGIGQIFLYKNGSQIAETSAIANSGDTVPPNYLEDYASSPTDYYEIFAAFGVGAGKNTIVGDKFKFQMKYLGA